MNDIYLEKPTLTRRKEAISFIEEYIKHNERAIGSGYLDKYYLQYVHWLTLLDKYKNQETCPSNVSPGYTFFLIKKSTNKIIGITNIRTKCKNLNMYLHGGNIGYSIRPSERKKGYGKELLRLCLQECKKLGMENVIIVTTDNNKACQKIIEANHGKIINSIPSEESQNQLDLRYRIILN